MALLFLIATGIVIAMTAVATFFFYQGYRLGLGKRLFRLTVSVGVFVIDDLERFLFYRRPDGILSIAAGAVLPWEHPEGAAHREWHEETDLDAGVTELDIFGIIDIHPVITGELSQAYGIGYVARFSGQLTEDRFIFLDKEEVVALKEYIYKPDPFTLHFIKRYGMKPLLPLSPVSQVGFHKEKYDREMRSIAYRLFKFIYKLLYKSWPPKP